MSVTPTAIGNTYLTLLDYAKRENPDGGIADIIEVLAASNPIIADANVMEGNLITGHRSVQRATQPSGAWRLLNGGVVPEKSLTTQVDDTCGMLEAYSKVDVDVAELGGNAAAFPCFRGQCLHRRFEQHRGNGNILRQLKDKPGTDARLSTSVRCTNLRRL